MSKLADLYSDTIVEMSEREKWLEKAYDRALDVMRDIAKADPNGVEEQGRAAINWLKTYGPEVDCVWL